MKMRKKQKMAISPIMKWIEVKQLSDGLIHAVSSRRKKNNGTPLLKKLVNLTAPDFYLFNILGSGRNNFKNKEEKLLKENELCTDCPRIHKKNDAICEKFSYGYILTATKLPLKKHNSGKSFSPQEDKLLKEKGLCERFGHVHKFEPIDENDKRSCKTCQELFKLLD